MPENTQEVPQDPRLEKVKKRLTDDAAMLASKPGSGFAYETNNGYKAVVIQKPPPENERPKGYEHTIPVMLHKRKENSYEYSHTRVWVDVTDDKLPVYEAVREDGTVSNVFDGSEKMNERPDLREDVLDAASGWRKSSIGGGT
jgi:hypothetical protein